MRTSTRTAVRSTATGVPPFVTTLMIAIGLIVIWAGLVAM
jgi:hypothetical protein